MTVLERRVAVAQATLDRFMGQPLVYGRVDCARIVAFSLRQLGVRTPLAKFGRYSSARGAVRALRRQGHEDLRSVMDSMGLRRIPPAAALPADIIALAAEDMPVSLSLALGNGRVLGFHANAEGAVVIQPHAFAGAWSAI